MPKKQPKPNKKKTRSGLKRTMSSMDQLMRDLSRMLDEQEFESAEDANQFLQEMMQSGQPIPTSEARSDLDRAQDLVYQAQDARSKREAIKLAKKALDVSKDCADAYVLLADLDASTLDERRRLYEAGVEAGERAIGDEFEEIKGHFWGMIETRPYMRARLGLAMTLWQMDELDRAAEHMAAMLDLNPNDNQGVRLLYLTLLLEQGNLDMADTLLDQYGGDWSAHWKYGRALYEFLKNGAGGKADEVLSDAIAYNSHVPDYLLGRKKRPKHGVGYYSPGDENEAIDYAQDGIRAWKTADGALAWLEEQVDELDNLR